MSGQKETRVKRDIVTVLLGAVLITELALFVFYNLFHINVVDPDLSMIFRHVEEIVKKRTLFISDWMYTTTGEFDCPLFFAVAFYALTKNIYLSYAFSNIISVAAYLFLLYALLKKAGVSLKYRILCLVIVFAPFSLYGLRYTNMMFYNGGQYAYKVFIPMLLVFIASDNLNRKFSLKRAVLIAVYLFLLLLTSISSGLYVMLCGILPVFVCSVTYLYRGYLKENRLGFCFIAVLSFTLTGAGLFMNRFLGIESKTYSLRGLEEIAKSFLPTVTDLFELFVPFSSHMGSVKLDPFSVNGMAQLLCMVIAGVIVVFGIFSVGKCFGAAVKKDGKEDEPGFTKEFIESHLISISVWNFLILVLMTETTPRYHLIGMLPLEICAVINMERYFSEKKGLLLFISEKAFLVLFPAAFLLYSAFSVYYMHTEYIHLFDERQRFMSEVIGYMDENGIDTMFSDDSGTVENLRFMAPEKTFVKYDPLQNGVISNKDYYYHNCDRSSFSDRNLIVLTIEGANKGAEYFPSYIVENYSLVRETDEYRFFESDHCPLDGLAGFPTADHSIDLPVTNGYQYIGEIDAAGALHASSAGDILISPTLQGSAKKSYELTLHYSAAPGSDAVLHIYENGNETASYPLVPGNSEVKAQFPKKAADYSFVVTGANDGQVLIGSMDFDVN